MQVGYICVGGGEEITMNFVVSIHYLRILGHLIIFQICYKIWMLQDNTTNECKYFNW